MPMLPSDNGWFSGNAPFPMNVVATGAISKSDIWTNSSDAPEVMTPPPARMIGHSAWAKRSAASLIFDGFGSDGSL